MNDTTVAEQTRPMTRNDLARLGPDAINRDQTSKVTVSSGGLTFANAVEVMDFAKLMSTGGVAVPKHLRANPGACIRIVVQAIEWRMSPFAVADKSYEVNDRLAYESQLIHAIVEARAQLTGRLRAEYSGEGPTRQCKIIGTFIGETAPHEYTSPEFAKIKVKNSPLWHSDPDQQLFYYASRAWARRWAPDVLMGIYTRDELASDPRLGREEEPPTTLLNNGAKVDRSEGYQGHEQVHGELANVAGNTPTTIDAKADPETQAETATKPKRTRKKQEASEPVEQQQADQPTTEQATEDKPAAEPDAEKEQAPPAQPTDAAEYQTYALGWIDAAADDAKKASIDRWYGEVELRRTCKVPSPLTSKIRKRLEFKYSIEL